MAEENAPQPAPPMRSKDEIALELMKFIAVQTGFGRGHTAATGFSGKPSGRTPEEHADALLELFDRCRRAIGK
ncbi:MAG: hypothetical protein M1436_06020 [Acidobacteria bacterium]|nr:hypothetical protein [Acidobacteriota bacterium]